jgi:hypothetical protein
MTERKPRTPEQAAPSPGAIFGEIDSLKSKIREIRASKANAAKARQKAYRKAYAAIDAAAEKMRRLKLRIAEMKKSAESILREHQDDQTPIKEMTARCNELYRKAREMGVGRPRTPDQHAKNRRGVAAKQAARAIAEGRKPGIKGRPPVPCGGCGAKSPKGPNGKCLHCGTKPGKAKKVQKKTCAS